VDGDTSREECGVVGCEFLSFGGSSPPDARVDCGGLVGGNGGNAAGDRVCPCNAFFGCDTRVADADSDWDAA
jgi:hypothetical protein